MAVIALLVKKRLKKTCDMHSFTNNILYDIVFEFCRYISKIFECVKEVGLNIMVSKLFLSIMNNSTEVPIK